MNPVVVAGDRTGANIDIRADGGVAEIREVSHLRAGAKGGIFDLPKIAHVDTFASDLPQGYKTKVGERGVKLSGGQKQRIALARAFLRQGEILLLDEATNALDSENEHHIQEALDLLLKDKTAIIIAHRLSTIQKVDRILVLDQGRLVEEGTHDTLMARGGLYARLAAKQFGPL